MGFVDHLLVVVYSWNALEMSCRCLFGHSNLLTTLNVDVEDSLNLSDKSAHQEEYLVDDGVPDVSPHNLGKRSSGALPTCPVCAGEKDRSIEQKQSAAT